MNRTAFTPVAIALWLAFGAAQAQGIADGTSNTLLVREAATRPGAGGLVGNLPQFGDGSVRSVTPQPASLTTRGTVSGQITQRSDQTGFVSTRQTVAIGSADGVANATGSLSAQGSLVGSATQSRIGNPGTSGNVAQLLSIGGLSGSITAATVTTNGIVATDVVQRSQVASRGVGSQTLAVATVADSGGGSLTANGTVSGPGLTQLSGNQVGQDIGVGSIRGASVQSAQTNGTVSGQITQTTGSAVLGSASQVQRVSVADIRDAQAQAITTQGTLTGAVTQTQNQGGSAGQAVEIGSVVGTDASGSITTQATVSANVSQNTRATGQALLVAAVVGGAPTQADARATLVGTVSQSATSAGSNQQRISVGAIEGSTGKVSTDANVNATLSQNLSGSASGRTQQISIAGAEQTQGDVTTRAVVTGSVSQTSQNNAVSAAQRVRIGSAINTGAAAVQTDATVAGTISQFSASQSRETQTILIGSVVGQ